MEINVRVFPKISQILKHKTLNLINVDLTVFNTTNIFFYRTLGIIKSKSDLFTPKKTKDLVLKHESNN